MGTVVTAPAAAGEGGPWPQGFWEQSGGTAVWVLGIFAVAVFIGLVRLGSGLLRRHRGNRLLPVVVCEDRGLLGGHGNGHRGAGPGGPDQGQESAATAELAAYITEHMAADALGPNVLTPGSGTTIGPDPAPETASSPHGWVDVMKRLAFFRPRAYHVMLHCLSTGDQPTRFSVRILYMPKNTVVAAAIMEAGAPEPGATDGGRRGADRELYERVACYCTVKILADPRSQDRIPRWESWGDDPDAYHWYRMGTKAQEEALAANKHRDVARERARYEEALKHFDKAAALVPGNLTVRLHQAGVLELMSQFPGVAEPGDHIRQAVEIYQYCVRLWPEHLETAYRLSIARAEESRHPALRQERARRGEPGSREHLRLLLGRLSRRAILRRYTRTWLPGRRNLGERRYWRQWWAMERPRPSLRTRRRSFRGAVRIASAAEVLRENGSPGPDELRTAFRDVAREVTGGWARWARLWGGPDWGLCRLLYADHRDGADHAGGDAHRRAGIAGSAPRHRGSNRAAAGYLVNYNAACFLSLALAARPPVGSAAWADDEWREDCARAAVVQLNTSLRVTRSQFSAAWAERDSDLLPLFTGRLDGEPVTGWGEIGRNWARFTGIDVTEGATAAHP